MQRVYLVASHAHEITLDVQWFDDDGDLISLDDYEGFAWIFSSYAFTIRVTEDNYLTIVDDTISLNIPKPVVANFRDHTYGYHRLTVGTVGSDEAEPLFEGGVFFRD